ncbi:ParA family protein (plasmid) [Streptomyces sp. BR1]|uniref:ParA family protein n=1 Tax=Streptomyces sp. BR1 TaxID=1592323 RepID=UPI00402B8C47
MAVEGVDCVAEVSEKGGVGKTSVTAGLIAVAAELGLRVGGVDLDPRGTLTDELGIDDPEKTVNDLYYIDEKKPPVDPVTIAPTVMVRAGRKWPANVFVLPADRSLSNREKDGGNGMEYRLKRALWALREEIDVFFIDAPPRAGGQLVGSALIAAKKALIPSTLSADGWSGVSQALVTISHQNAPGGPNEDLEVAGIVRSIVPRETELREIHRMWDKRLAEDFGDLLLPTLITNYAVRETARTARAPITSAPGREAKTLVGAYRDVLFHTLPHLKEARG